MRRNHELVYWVARATRELREERGRTPEEVAIRLGEGSVTEWEAQAEGSEPGQPLPEFLLLAAYAAVLDLEIEQIVERGLSLQRDFDRRGGLGTLGERSGALRAFS